MEEQGEERGASTADYQCELPKFSNQNTVKLTWKNKVKTEESGKHGGHV